ncbi:hypothetical protein B0H67DRAFT_524238 [Lasiosphaeris hirsuta]|uniref:FAD-binding domain-containing protein n=1 Tax=Lasiosphaeris hirsuta TaxID=260670 RepID=A0AA40DHP9_9PEZI|nr:hypothetical protein B0H67DRAFT_524238 [Lasiosphaeris hirsuta]
MKIIITGAGIAGLSTYLHLRKHLPNPPGDSPDSQHTIHIYESHHARTSSNPQPPETFDTLSSSTALVGGGLGVSPNGMRVLHDLSPQLHAAVATQGYPCENFIFMGQNGWTLGVQRTGDKGGFEGLEGREEVCVALSRGGLWKCLMDEVGEGVVRYRKVVSVRERENGGGVVVFEDGGEEGADLVVGADGVRSVVRSGLFGASYGPVYTGVSGIGGFIKGGPLPARVVDNRAMVFTFGRTGFFGYASGSPAEANNLMWWSSFETDSLPSKTNLNPEEIKAELKKRHSAWADPTVQDIVDKAEVESIYPTWVLPDLPHWGENGIVLVGDAAHAMSPTTGQGASQALEDGQTLALLLAETLTKAYASAPTERESTFVQDGKEAVALTMHLFYQIRKPRVAEIVERGRKLDRGKNTMGVIAEYSMYCFLWVMMHFPSVAKRILGDVNVKLYGWSAKQEIKEAFEKME